MNLAAVTTVLQDRLNDGVLTLDSGAAGSVGLGGICDALSTKGLRLDGAEIQASASELTLSGTARLLGAPVTVLTLRFTKAGRATDVEAVAKIVGWSPPGAEWLRVDAASLTLFAPAGADAVTVTVEGEAVVAGTSAAVSVTVAEELRIGFRASRLALSTLADELFAPVGGPPDGLPDLALEDVAVEITPSSGEFRVTAGAFATPWTLSVGELAVRDVELAVERVVGADGAHVTSLRLEGVVDVGQASARAVYEFPGELRVEATIPAVPLGPALQDLCGAAAAMGLDVPPGVLDLELTDVALVVEPGRGTASLAAGSPLGALALHAFPIDDGHGFVAVVQPPARWHLSTLADELSVLDGLDMSGWLLALSSTSEVPDDLEVPGLPDDVDLAQGLTVLASLATAGSGLDDLLGVDRLDVRAVVGADLSDLLIGCVVETDLALADGVVFSELSLELRPAPAAFSLELAGVLLVEVGGSRLRFTGGLEVRPRAALMKTTMEGSWHEPLGARGVVLSDVALQLGLSFPPLLPSVGFAGTLQIGTFRGSAAVAFNAAAPAETMLAIAFNELHLLDLVGAMGGQHIVAAVPPELRRTVLDIGMRDVDIAVVPVDTTIGELHFERGTRARGELTFWGVRGRGSLVIDERTGVSGSAQLDPVSLGGGALTLTASGGAGGPSLSLELPPLAVPSIFLSGAVSLLGLSADTQITFSDQGFTFHLEGMIFDLFSCSLDAKGSFAGLASDVWLRVALRNDLFEYLRREATEAIRVAAEAATRDIEAARRDVARAQADVNRLNGDIAAMRRTIQAERDRDAANLQAAQASVASAQREVARLDGDIAAMRRTIEAERDRDAGNLRSAQASVASAQRDVNSIQAEIDAAKATIAGLERDIAAKRRWFDRLAWWDKTWAWTVLSGYSTAKGAEITANYTKIGALEAAKHTAIGTLELAKQTLRGFEAAARTVPVDADPRIVGLFTARGTAMGTLELAKQTLAGFEVAAKTFPIDADPRIVGLFTALGTATAGLTVADGVLQATQASVGAVADVATFIANVGLGGLIDIRAASFEAYLSAAAGGNVQLDMVLSFMQRPLTLRLAIDLTNPLSAARALADRLLEGLGR